jgi:hypothetical protein
MQVTSNLFKYQQSKRSEGARLMIAQILALLGNVVLWASYAFAAVFLVLLVYAASQGGARDIETWAITLSVCAAAIVFGLIIQYILGGKRKAYLGSNQKAKARPGRHKDREASAD